MATDINITIPPSRPIQVQASAGAAVRSSNVQGTPPNTTQSNAAPSQPVVSKPTAADSKQIAQNISEKADKSAEELQDFQDKLEEAVSNINEYTQNIQRSLQFSISDADGRTIIKVIDSETNQIVRQIPPDEVLSISENLGSAGNGGLFFQTKV